MHPGGRTDGFPPTERHDATTVHRVCTREKRPYSLPSLSGGDLLIAEGEVERVQISPVLRGHALADENSVFTSVRSDDQDERGLYGSAAASHYRLDDLPTSLFKDRMGFEKHVSALNPEQKGFIYDLFEWIGCPTNRVSIVTGGPGTGKTFAVIRTLQFLHLSVLSLAYTARIARRNGGYTIHSAFQLGYGEGSIAQQLASDLRRASEQHLLEGSGSPLPVAQRLQMSRVLYGAFRFRLGKYPQIVFIDEVSMIDDGLLYWLIRYLFDRVPSNQQVFVVVVGDKDQLTPVDSPHNVFGSLEAFREAFGPIRITRLTQSMRFDPHYDHLIRRIREIVQQSPSEDLEEEDDLIQFIRKEFPVVEEVDESLLKRCHRALVFRNETVRQYNRFYLDRFPGKRVRLFQLHGGQLNRENFVDLKNNCDVFVTKNTKSLSNGTPLVFLRYDAQHDRLVCKLPDTQQTVQVERDCYSGQFPVIVGFAGTIHKFQGDTVDDTVLFNFDGCRNRDLIYTALSRVRSLKQIAGVAL